jgi:Tetracyclin repressor-like, C-terminal domain
MANLLNDISKRFHDATVALLASAPDVRFENLDDVTFALLAAMTGATRVVFERGAIPGMLRVLRTQLATMCHAYLQQAAAGKAAPASDVATLQF